MIEFPDTLLQNSLTIAFLKRYTDIVLDLCKTPYEDVNGRKQKEHAYNVWKGAHDKANKGYDFVIAYEQINPVDLALDVINYVDPVYSKSETMDEKCARCHLNAQCSFKCYDKPEHRFRWCPMGSNAKFLNPIARELTSSEMAELALTHLS
jgi:hypothetical protein